MPSRFESRFHDVSTPKLEREFGVLVRFARGVYASAEFTARRSDRVYNVVDGYGIAIQITMRDFVLPVSTTLIDSDAVEPRTGDRIVEGDEVFEIQPPDERSPSVELLAGSFEYLCHTKRIES